MNVPSPMPEPPFRVGQRVRCVVSTLGRGDPDKRVELRGRVGEVIDVRWVPTGSPHGFWRVRVQYQLGPPSRPRYHQPEDLEPA